MSEGITAIGAPRRLEVRPPSRVWTTRLYIAAVVIVAAIGYLVYTAMQSTSVYYLTVSELKAQPASVRAGHAVRVAGVVQAGSIERSTTSSLIKFVVSDGGGTMPVVYSGPVPDIFGNNIQVVVEGQYASDGVFHASTLLAKCPSKFQAAIPTPISVLGASKAGS